MAVTDGIAAREARVQAALREGKHRNQSTVRTEGSDWPIITAALADKLKKVYPIRLKKIGEPEEVYQRYAGKAELSEFLVGIYESYANFTVEGLGEEIARNLAEAAAAEET